MRALPKVHRIRNWLTQVARSMGWENNVWLPLGNPGEGAQGRVKHQAQPDKASPLTSTRWALDGLVDWRAGPA